LSGDAAGGRTTAWGKRGCLHAARSLRRARRAAGDKKGAVSRRRCGWLRPRSAALLSQPNTVACAQGATAQSSQFGGHRNNRGWPALRWRGKVRTGQRNARATNDSISNLTASGTVCRSSAMDTGIWRRGRAWRAVRAVTRLFRVLPSRMPWRGPRGACGATMCATPMNRPPAEQLLATRQV
jgi:hypothetical protein